MNTFRARRLQPLHLSARWRRVPTPPHLAATFVLDVDARGGRARVEYTRAAVAPFATPPGSAVVTTLPGSIVYATARARGVALLIGSRAPRDDAAEVTYVRFFVDAAGHDVSVDVVWRHREHRPTRATERYSYALPNGSTATADFGARTATELVLAAARARRGARLDGERRSGARRTRALAEPPGLVTSLPHDAYQIAAFIARECRARRA